MEKREMFGGVLYRAKVHFFSREPFLRRKVSSLWCGYVYSVVSTFLVFTRGLDTCATRPFSLNYLLASLPLPLLDCTAFLANGLLELQNLFIQAYSCARRPPGCKEIERHLRGRLRLWALYL